MKRNIYGTAAIGAVAVAVLALSACMMPRAADQSKPASESQSWDIGGVQGHGPYGADPDAHFHRLSSDGQAGY